MDQEHIDRMIRIASGKEPRFEQTKECARCGACCEHDECEHLSYEDGLAVCGIYEDRPMKCREFPVGPPIVYEKCGYRFKDRVDGTVLRKKEAR